MTTAAKDKPPRHVWRGIATTAAAAVLLLAVALHQIFIVVLAAVFALLAGVLVLRARWARYAAGGRIAAWRRRRHQGPASWTELYRHTSRPGGRHPDLHRHERTNPVNPLTRTVYAGYRDSVAFTGPAQSGKTNALIRVALGLPGALFTASTRGHLAEATVIARSRKGPVWLADPSGEGGFPTNLICSPLSGCRDYRVATDSAGELIQAMPRDAHNTGIWWDRKGAQWLKMAMHAAAWEPGATMLDVADWAADLSLWAVPVKILASCPPAARGWAMELAKMCRAADGDPHCTSRTRRAR